jgi:hypothetical protein
MVSRATYDLEDVRDDYSTEQDDEKMDPIWVRWAEKWVFFEDEPDVDEDMEMIKIRWTGEYGYYYDDKFGVIGELNRKLSVYLLPHFWMGSYN